MTALSEKTDKHRLPRKRGLFYFCEIFENNMWGQQGGKQVISKLEQVGFNLELDWNILESTWDNSIYNII